MHITHMHTHTHTHTHTLTPHTTYTHTKLTQSILFSIALHIWHTNFWDWKEGNILFNDTRNTFYLRLYCIGHMVSDHSDTKRGYSFQLTARVILYATGSFLLRQSFIHNRSMVGRHEPFRIEILNSLQKHEWIHFIICQHKRTHTHSYTYDI